MTKTQNSESEDKNKKENGYNIVEEEEVIDYEVGNEE